MISLSAIAEVDTKLNQSEIILKETKYKYYGVFWGQKNQKAKAKVSRKGFSCVAMFVASRKGIKLPT